MAITFNLNDNATQVLMSKRIKENYYVDLAHRPGLGCYEPDEEELDATTVRIQKTVPLTGEARKLGGDVTNGGWKNTSGAEEVSVIEYDLNLLYVYDTMVDIPTVQKDVVGEAAFNRNMKNIGGRVSTEINASTIAHQLIPKFNKADDDNAWGDGVVEIAAPGVAGAKIFYNAFVAANSILDDGSETDGIQQFPIEERECICRTSFRNGLMSEKGVFIGGSNYAQSMIAKGGLDPDSRKEDNGSMYIGEIDLVPFFMVPKPIWKRAGEWVGSATAFDDVEAIVMSAIATDRGISRRGFVNTVPCPDAAGTRLQPLTRWGINVCYPSGIIPIVKQGATVPSSQLTIKAPGNK